MSAGLGTTAPVDPPPTGLAGGPTWSCETALVAASLVGGWALVHLVRSSPTHHAIVPVLVVCATVATASAAAGRRWKPSVLVLAGVPVSLLAATWVVLPGATRDGLPTPTTLRVLHHALVAARPTLTAFSLPLSAGRGIVWLAAGLGATAAVAARTLLAASRHERTGSPLSLGPLAPMVALVVASGLLRPDVTAVALATVAAALCLLGLALRHGRGTARPPGRPNRHAGRSGAVVMAGVGVLAATGTAFGVAAAAPVPARRPTVATLLLQDRVTTARQEHARLVVFTARAAVPTYWQVATLSRFRKNRWPPGPTVAAVAAGRPLAALPASSPPGLPDGGTTGRVAAFRVELHAYSGRLLPAPPGTVSASPSSAIAVRTGVGAVVWQGQGQVPVPFRYLATASVAPLGPAASGTSAPSGSAASDLALPPLPPPVANLARQAVAGATSPLARVRALLAFFATGGFRYVTTPPPPPAGSDPLVWFLTTSRRGSCQQFAGAFAVLARLDGLPTRVAVGFTSGSLQPDGETVVRGSDAHAWPEVYLGAGLGWRSVEPTPAAGDGSLVPATVLRPSGSSEVPGTGAASQGPTAQPPPTTTVTSPTATPTTASPAPTTPSATSPPPPATPPGSGVGHAGMPVGVPALAIVLAGAAVAAAIVLGFASRRTLQWRVARRLRRRGWGAPASTVLAAWAELDRRLARSGWARPPHRTAIAHARAVGAGLPPAFAADLALVATEADAAVFAPDPPSSATAADVVAATRRLRRALTAGRAQRRPRVNPRRPGSGAPTERGVAAPRRSPL